MLTRRPYIQLGVTQQSRVVPTKLTERHLNLQIASKRAAPLGDLLLASGAAEGPYRATKPMRRSRVRRFIRTVVAFFLAPRPFT